MDIACPECDTVLSFEDVKEYATQLDFERYELLAVLAVVGSTEQFVWCSGPDCNSGQLHVGGAEQPIVLCNLCRHRTCFVHRTPWHEDLTCDDYDRLQQDPANFRTRAELERAAEQEQLEVDRQEAERIDREQREAQEMRRIALKRRAQEQQNEATINKTTKPCPKCASNIEKKGGWYVLPCPPLVINMLTFAVPICSVISPFFRIVSTMRVLQCHCVNHIVMGLKQVSMLTSLGTRYRHRFCWTCLGPWNGRIKCGH
ncbi:uncharacterized protein F5Z01DRAFT_413846 [Emericellopsis atlantica]|uniref:RBR-type E3 ubiquitin transferase n=1 Tax=Emericellopsis atlantica TaxID=2614577 RepID=A0A9P7ZSW5_9HYPO|nr:uncharacterized protein F5Z01DRAFT_413846 [Emericellopsis atlantica]KAG9257749.1 hypothetical protein F5Z01DRAFT_413846 [Emericellopsis atlantica]